MHVKVDNTCRKCTPGYDKPGGGYSYNNWVGECGSLPKVLAPFKTIFPSLFLSLSKIQYSKFKTLKSTPCFRRAFQLAP